MIPFDKVDQTRYVTEFRERETGNELYRTGTFVGTLVIPEGERPFLDREAHYDVVETHKADPGNRGVDAVFSVSEDDE